MDFELSREHLTGPDIISLRFLNFRISKELNSLGKTTV